MFVVIMITAGIININMSITKFKIIGERNSGTNFLRIAILSNFNLEEVESNNYNCPTGHKHFFNHKNISRVGSNTLTISIIRNYIDWVNSMRIRPWHLHWNLHKLKIEPTDLDFFNDNFYSVKGNSFPRKEDTDIIMEDLHIYEGRKYKNICESRKIKSLFLLDDAPLILDNYEMITYENIKNNYEDIIYNLSTKFNISLKYSKPVKPTTFKGIKGISYNSGKIKNKIWSNQEILMYSKGLDLEVEKRIGYYYG